MPSTACYNTTSRIQTIRQQRGLGGEEVQLNERGVVWGCEIFKEHRKWISEKWHRTNNKKFYKVPVFLKVFTGTASTKISLYSATSAEGSCQFSARSNENSLWGCTFAKQNWIVKFQMTMSVNSAFELECAQELLRQGERSRQGEGNRVLTASVEELLGRPKHPVLV